MLFSPFQSIFFISYCIQKSKILILARIFCYCYHRLLYLHGIMLHCAFLCCILSIMLVTSKMSNYIILCICCNRSCCISLCFITLYLFICITSPLAAFIFVMYYCDLFSFFRSRRPTATSAVVGY